MKRLLALAALLLPLLLAQPSVAGPGDVTFAAGILAPYDADTGKSAFGWHLTYAVGITDRFELGAMYTKSGNYEGVNNLTQGEVEVSTLLIQGRCTLTNIGDGRLFMDLGGGMMDVDPKGPSVTENRPGAAVRIGIGMDHPAGPFDLRLGIGYTRGIGRTSEIDMLETSLSILFGREDHK